MSKTFALLWGLCLFAAFGCSASRGDARGALTGGAQAATPQSFRQSDSRPRPSSGSVFLDRLSDAAVERTSHEVRYDPTYFVIDYPGGDVPAEVGVCTDEVIRSYRALGVDLQQLVHEELPRRVHDASRNAVFQAMLAWGDASDERAVAMGTEGGGGFGPATPARRRGRCVAGTAS